MAASTFSQGIAPSHLLDRTTGPRAPDRTTAKAALQGGSSTIVGNLLAGLQLTYSRSYREGDRIQLGEIYGDVVELGTFATKVRTIQEEEVTIPNTLAQTWAIVNYSRGLATGIEVKSEVTISYDAP